MAKGKDVQKSAKKAPTRTLKETIQEMSQWINRRGPEEFKYDLELEFITDKTPETWVKRLI